MQSFFLSSFFLNIFLVLLYSSFLAAIVGSIMQMGRLSSMAGSISHTILAGVGLATWLGFSLWVGSIAVALLACLIVAFINVYSPKQLEITSNILWGGGMALGILLTSFSSGYQQNLSNFLFGNIVLVSRLDSWIILSINIFILLLLSSFYRQLVLVWFSPIFSKIQQLNQFFLWFLSLFMISLGVISLVKTMGIALALVLLSVPNHIARLLKFSGFMVIIISFIIGFISMFMGILFSYYLGSPAGATTALVCIGFYILPIIYKCFQKI